MTSSLPKPYLVTGATGGLGSALASTLHTLVPAHSIILTSSSTSKEEELQAKYPGTQFRVVNYDDEPEALEKALEGVGKLFFVSSNMMDPARKGKQHGNVVKAAKGAGVDHRRNEQLADHLGPLPEEEQVYYSSQAFGGYSDASSVFLMQSHLTTEKALRESGIPFTSCRCAVYTEGFPIVITWYPNTDVLYLPEGINPAVAFASRADLGEAIARLMASSNTASLTDPSTNTDIVLLTTPKTATFTQIASAIASAQGRELPVQYVPVSEWAAKMAEEDAKPGRGSRPKQFFDMWLLLLKGLQAGEAGDVDGLMDGLLKNGRKDGREAKDTLELVEELVRKGMENGGEGYRWPPRAAGKN